MLSSGEKEDFEGNVLIVGGGIAGIQSSLNLVHEGFKVYLAERSTTIGGRVAQHYKVFPSNSNSVNFLVPKMLEVYHNPNIEILTNTDVREIYGKLGNYRVELKTRPRFIDPTKCKGCGDCVKKCPKIEAPDLFNMNLSKRKSVYIPFPHAIPPTYIIDPELCLKLTKNVCGTCQKNCKAVAINFEEKSEKKTIEVGAVVVATGFDILNKEYLHSSGYPFENIVTSLEFERILSDSGPFDGALLRPSDGENPHTIAFIQYDKLDSFQNFAKIDILYTSKQVVNAKERLKDLRCIIIRDDRLFEDAKAFKFASEFQEGSDINYINGSISSIYEDPETKDLIITYKNLKDKSTNKIRVNLGVLSCPIYPSDGTERLVYKLKISTDSYGYLEGSALKGVLPCGSCTKPMNITDTIDMANTVSHEISILLEDAKYKEIDPLTVQREVPSDLDMLTQEFVYQNFFKELEVNHEKCIGCGSCFEACPHGAIEMKEIMLEYEDFSMLTKKSTINSKKCKECGICFVECPNGAIYSKYCDIDNLEVMKRAFFFEKIKQIVTDKHKIDSSLFAAHP